MAVTLTMERLWTTKNIADEQYTKYGVFKITFDSSYPTGGEPWNLSSYFNNVFDISCTPDGDGTPGYLPVVKDTNFAVTSNISVMLFCQGVFATSSANRPLTQCTAGRQMQSVVIRALVVGN